MVKSWEGKRHLGKKNPLGNGEFEEFLKQVEKKIEGGNKEIRDEKFQKTLKRN